MPHELNPLILANRRALLASLLQDVRNTIPAAFAADPQWRIEGKIGLLAGPHTWNQTLVSPVCVDQALIFPRNTDDSIKKLFFNHPAPPADFG